MNIEQQVLCLAARTRLDASGEDRLLGLLQGPLDWEQLYAQGHLHEVLPLLAMNLRRLQSQAAIPPHWMTQAQRRFYATLLRNTTLADELLQVFAALRDAGVEALPVKGIVLAEMLYGNLALRPAADLDILVRPNDLPAAREALHSLGFARRVEPTFADLYHPFHDPVYFRQTVGGEVCLELHHALWAPRFFHIEIDIFWERAVVGYLHGTQVHLLSPEDMLLHLVIHRSRSPLRLRFVCDIAELLGRYSTILDWDYLLQQAYMGGARTALFFGLTLAHELLGAPLPPDVLPQLSINRIKRQVLEHTCGVTALFRPAAPGDLSQQPHFTLRVLEQDGVRQILSAFVYSLMRTERKRIHNSRRLRRLVRIRG